MDKCNEYKFNLYLIYLSLGCGWSSWLRTQAAWVHTSAPPLSLCRFTKSHNLSCLRFPHPRYKHNSHTCQGQLWGSMSQQSLRKALRAWHGERVSHVPVPIMTLVPTTGQQKSNHRGVGKVHIYPTLILQVRQGRPDKFNSLSKQRS